MKNIIAIIWDFDKTLVDGYMQDPIFDDYNVDAHEFWTEVNTLPKKYEEEQHVKVNPDTIYLNQFIRYAKTDKFGGLNNAKLKSYGARQNFYYGIPEIFKHTNEMLKDDPVCEEYNIKVEHYIVSTGFAEVIRGTELTHYRISVLNSRISVSPTITMTKDLWRKIMDEVSVSEVIELVTISNCKI